MAANPTRIVDIPRAASTMRAAMTVAEFTGRLDRTERGTTVYVLSRSPSNAHSHFRAVCRS